jgi:hypothetical protein
MSADEARIARGVISQALSDAGIGIAKGYRVMVSPLDRDEARSFLLSPSGAWKQAREFWCTLADLDPDRLRSRTRELLDAEDVPPLAPVAPPTPPPLPKRRDMRKRKAPRSGTKLADVFYLINRPEGVDPDELVKMLGWTRSTSLTAISDLRTYGIVSKRCGDGRYRVLATLDSGNGSASSAVNVSSHEQVGPVSN